MADESGVNGADNWGFAGETRGAFSEEQAREHHALGLLQKRLDKMIQNGELGGFRRELLEAILAESDKDVVARGEKVIAALKQTTKPRLVLESAADAIEAFPDLWANPKPAISTGLRRLDRVLSGGLRAGDMIALAGHAKGGKSALTLQIAYDYAKGQKRSEEGASIDTDLHPVVVYLSPEMTRAEMVARWIAREAFAIRLEKRLPAVTYSAVLYGKAWRHEIHGDEKLKKSAHEALIDAMTRVKEVVGPKDKPRVFAQKLPAGSTPWDVRELVKMARDKHDGAPVLLVVDPLQRLFAGASGMMYGRALDTINSAEISRVAAVAEQLKTIADDDGVAVIFSSDTTKESVKTSGGSSTGLRGSYQLNHWATAIFGMQTADTPEALVARLQEGGIIEDGKKSAESWAAKLLDETEPYWFDGEKSTSLKLLNFKYTLVECSGIRNGKPEHIPLGWVPGAMAFFEGEDHKKQ